MNLSKRNLILILTAIFLIIFSFFIIIPFLLRKDAGYLRYQTCEQIDNKIEKQELMRLMAEPYQTEKSERGIVYYYHEAMLAAGPIRVMLDNQDSMVIGTKCSEDGKWKFF